MPIWMGLLVLVAYVFAIIGLAEFCDAGMVGETSLRKVVHIGVGMFSWFIPFVFDSPWPFVLACLAFSVLTYLDARHLHLFDAMASKDDESNLGNGFSTGSGGGCVDFLGLSAGDGGCADAVDMG